MSRGVVLWSHDQRSGLMHEIRESLAFRSHNFTGDTAEEAEDGSWPVADGAVGGRFGLEFTVPLLVDHELVLRMNAAHWVLSSELEWS